ncbi:FmdB family zinc ribbon protein [Desulfoplanes sp.]
MPIYEFECAQCKHQFEEVVLAQDEPVTCPECGSQEVKKLLSSGSFVTGGPVVLGKAGSGAITTRGTSPCAACRGGNCASCSVK